MVGGADVLHEMTPTYGNKRESGPPLFQFLAPHFLCKIDSAFIDSVFFIKKEGGKIMY